MKRRVRLRPWSRDRAPLKIDWKGLAAAVVVVLGWWDARTKPDSRTAAVVSLSTSVAEQVEFQRIEQESLAVRMGRLRSRVSRLERKAVRGTDDRKSLAPHYDAESYGPQRPDPGLKASLGRLFSFWRHKDGR